MKINPHHIPEQFRHLIPLAEVWSINDDGCRADKIEAASPDEIHALTQAVLAFTDQLYFDWLGDATIIETDAKDAYIAFTALVLAAEES